MCQVCKTRFNIHEKIAAHDYYEQMMNFWGRKIKLPRKRRLTKKSLLSRIENQLVKLQIESNEQHLAELTRLMCEEADLQTMNNQFMAIMQNYYEMKLKA